MRFKVEGLTYTAVFNDSFELLENNKRNEATMVEDDAREGAWAIWFDYKGKPSKYAPYLHGDNLSVCFYLSYDKDGNKTSESLFDVAQIWDNDTFEEVEMQRVK